MLSGREQHDSFTVAPFIIRFSRSHNHYPLTVIPPINTLRIVPVKGLRKITLNYIDANIDDDIDADIDDNIDNLNGNSVALD